MIEQSEWREGLPDPSYERINTTVHNVIVHHSAGSNTDTNYTGIVRNIYIYHTEIRGWSDIGYNYLVAPDGSIFKGRDPGNLEQDNVLGAHFCASNSGTIGICVMGTYTEISPAPEAISSLRLLVNWKLGKDSLDPAGTYPHVLNAALPVIAGHRDGCATECPGEMLYQLLASFRYAVQDIFRACGYAAKPVVTGLKGSLSSGIAISYTAETITIRFGKGRIDQIQIFNLMGNEIHRSNQQVSPDEIVLFTEGMAAGLYLVKIIHKGNVYTDKLIYW
jgi:hypothetical protein